MASRGQQIVLFIDWLGLSLRLNGIPKPIPGYIWREYTATNVWNKRRVLWSERGDRICTLLSEPRSKILRADAALLEIENEWLYHGAGTEHILQLLLSSVIYEVLGVSRLDLAFDFNPDNYQRSIIEGLSENKYYIAGKQNGTQFWSTNNNEHLHMDWNGRRIPHQQSWGHKTSAIKWKLYYKTKELWDAGGGKFMEKPYIADKWRKFGLDESNVWRLEVSMQHLNDLRLYGERIDLDKIANNRTGIAVSMYNQRFKVKKNEGHADKTNDKTVTFLQMPNVIKGIEKAPARTMREHNGRITLLRHLVSSLDDEHVLLDEPSRMDVFQHVAGIVARDGLDNYFRAMTGKWLDEWIGEVDEDARQRFTLAQIEGGALHIDEHGRFAGQQVYDKPNFLNIRQMQNSEVFEDTHISENEVIKSKALLDDEEAIRERVRRLGTPQRKNDKPPTLFGDSLP